VSNQQLSSTGLFKSSCKNEKGQDV
jgi:hypothetical protein